MDRVPRRLDERQTEALQILARQVVAQLDLHREIVFHNVLESQLRKAHDEMEVRVCERTAELTAANASLKAAERASSDWKDRYDLIVASSGIAVYDIDRITGEVFWGSGAGSVLGIEPTGFSHAGKEWLELVHPQDRAALMRSMEAAMVAGLSFDLQYRLRRGHDHYRWIQDRGFVVPDAKGRCLRVVGMIQDVTQRKLAEDTMREQAALLDHTQDAIMVRDLQNHALYWNQTAERLYGWTVGEALGKSIQDLLFRGDLGHVLVAHKTALEQGKWSGEVKVHTKEGKELTVLSRWSLLRDGDGSANAFLVAHTDITGQKMLEAKFFRARGLKASARWPAASPTISTTSSPPILMSAQLLGEELDAATRAKTVGILAATARRGSEMVKQVLSFTRGTETGPGVVQIKHLLVELEQMMRDTLPRNIRIERPDCARSPFCPWRQHAALPGVDEPLRQLARRHAGRGRVPDRRNECETRCRGGRPRPRGKERPARLYHGRRQRRGHVRRSPAKDF